MTTTGWQTLAGEFPWPPANVQVVSPLFVGALDVRWDDPSILATGKATTLLAAAATVTVTGTPVTVETATGVVTVTSPPIAAGETVTVGDVTLTAVSGPAVAGSDTFDGTGTVAAIAASIAAAVNAGTLGGFGVATATSALGVVTLTAGEEGAVGNDLALATTTPVVTLSGSTFAGGADADVITVGLTSLHAVVGTRTSGSQDFSVGPTNFDTAASLSAAINDPNNLVSYVAATVSGDHVDLSASTRGSEGNAILLSTTSTVLDLSGTSLAGGAGDPLSCQGRNNSRWTIVGVNVYRSDDGERGPYIRINRFPVGTMFHRDFTDNILIENETVLWNAAWVSKGDATNDRRWAFRTVFGPIVKATETPPQGRANHMVAVHANAPSDVVVRIDGVEVPVDDVFGPNGEITLINQPTYDLARERTIPPRLPNEDGTSEVTVTYWYNRNLVKTDLERTTQIFYRVTSVALDPTSPSGYVETPLAYCPPVSVAQVETFDYIWREAVRRNNWILQQGGERVKLFKRKVSGIPCPCRVDERIQEYSKQPDARCVTCLGTGWVGAFDGPIDIILAPDDAERAVRQTANGRTLDHKYEVWTGPSPVVTQRDFVVKQTGERYSIGPVRRPAHRGLPLQQHFNIGYLDEQDIRYRMPVTGITELPWPETRLTDPNSPCDPQPPHPVGFDYQATPMETEVPKIPNERELRGRSPVWMNTMYGGKGT